MNRAAFSWNPRSSLKVQVQPSSAPAKNTQAHTDLNPDALYVKLTRKKLKILALGENLKVNLRILLRELCLYFLQQSFNRFFWKAVRSGKTHPDSGQSDRLTFWILILGT